MKAKLFYLLLIAAAGCGQPGEPVEPQTTAIEHLAETPVTADEVYSLRADQYLKVNLQENQKLRFESLELLHRVIGEIKAERRAEIIHFADLITGADTKTDPKTPVDIGCHKECNTNRCAYVCCVQQVGSNEGSCFPNPSR